MSKFELPKCPYCDKKVSFLRSGYIMSNPKYKCEACEKESFITVNHSIYDLLRICGIVFAITIILAAFFVRFRSFAVELMFLSQLAIFTFSPFCAKLNKKDGVEAKEETETSL